MICGVRRLVDMGLVLYVFGYFACFGLLWFSLVVSFVSWCLLHMLLICFDCGCDVA